MRHIRCASLVVSLVVGTPGLASPELALDERVAGPDTINAPHGRPGIESPTPEAWLERITKMRAAGDDDAADREVVALHRRYPHFVIPVDALGRTGKR